MADDKLREHNRRVKEAANKLPTPGLRDSYKALAYRADKNQSNDAGCVTSGIAMQTVSRLSRRYGYYRSVRSLWRDVNTLEQMGVIIRKDEPRNGKEQPPTTFHIWFRWDGSVPSHERPSRRAGTVRQPRPEIPSVTLSEPSEHTLGRQDECALCTWEYETLAPEKRTHHP